MKEPERSPPPDEKKPPTEGEKSRADDAPKPSTTTSALSDIELDDIELVEIKAFA